MKIQTNNKQNSLFYYIQWREEKNEHRKNHRN